MGQIYVPVQFNLDARAHVSISYSKEQARVLVLPVDFLMTFTLAGEPKQMAKLLDYVALALHQHEHEAHLTD
jgi:hypothetical protein